MNIISIIIPIHNGEKWINDCMKSILNQTVLVTNIKLEIVVHNDGSTDKTSELLTKWKKQMFDAKVNLIISESLESNGVGAAKNRAVERCNGQYLCFQDVDDVMYPDRILKQYHAACIDQNVLVGSKIRRHPPTSTPRLVNWINNLTHEQLKLQIYTSNGPTIAMPTWFCHRNVYDKVGGFDETGHGTPEDLIFFYKHLDCGGDITRVDDELLIYTYHENCATFTIAREYIWKIQLVRLEEHVLSKWKTFTIWNAGKAGRKLVRALGLENLKKVVSFCDVDENKIGKVIELYCSKMRAVIAKIPVIHFTAAIPPLLICVKFNLTHGEFENNLLSLNLKEGTDYIIFN